MVGADALKGIRGALLDVDGTLLNGDDPIPGAAEAVAQLRARSIRVRFVTNTTRRSSAGVASALRRAGIVAEDDEVLVPAVLARARILETGRLRATLLVPEESLPDFDGLVQDVEAPDWVVVGDLGPGFTFDVMNGAFRALRRGATLLALHKNPFWHAGERGFVIDAGAFVAGLEFAAGVRAEVMGKPAEPFFRMCLRDVAVPADAVVVVGDDPVNDAGGGTAAGCRTILVRTGKLAAASEADSLPADFVLPSIAHLGR